MRNLDDLKASGEAPQWLTSEGYTTMAGGYLLKDETPRQLYLRVSNAAASRLKRPELATKFYDILWRNYFGLSSPIASNLGTDNLPISCFSSSVSDDTYEIFEHYKEIAMLSKYGGGTGSYWGKVRGRGTPISKGGFSEGVTPWLSILDRELSAVSQAGVRRGSVAAYLDIEHLDIEEFLEIRMNTGDISQKCLSSGFHHGVCISDEFMKSLAEGNEKNKKLWEHILTNRVESGEPYLMFKDTANRANPACYKDKGLRVETSNLCLAGETQVLTKEFGPIEIQELVGKTVTIFDGIEWVSNSFFQKTQESAQLTRIHLSDGSTVDSTDNHRWFVKPAHLRESETKHYAEVRTSNLEIGMKVEFHGEAIEGSIPLKGAYIKGFLLAEGTRMQKSNSPISENKEYKPFLYLYLPKLMCFERLKKSAEEIPITKGLRSDAATEIGLGNENEGRAALKGIGSRRELLPWCTDFKKCLPEEANRWDFRSRCEFLAGLFDGDGTYMKTNGGYQLASINRTFLVQIQTMLKTLGIRSHVGLMRSAGTADFKDGYGLYNTKEAYRLTISSWWAYKFSDIVKFSRLPSYENRKPKRFCASFAEIVKIEKLENKAPAYCTTVPSTGKFALANGLMTGNCNEIFLHTDSEHTFVCCLASMNLARYDEWKNTDAVHTAIYFLDGVMQEFIDKARHIRGFEKAVRFAEKSRALGLGVIGWHTLLQSRMIPFDSFEAMALNAEVFRHIDKEATRATKDLAVEFGEPEWCVGHGIRNTHLTAIAPTTTNALLAGGVSQGIEPLTANIFNQKTSKGVFFRKNPILEKLLESKGQNTLEVWTQINQDRGSVKNVACLTAQEKEVFMTAREINQFAIVRQAGQRQKWISQGQSVNLFFAMPSDVTNETEKDRLSQYIHEVHLEAWQLGLKGLYYLKTESMLKGEPVFKDSSDCKACEG